MKIYAVLCRLNHCIKTLPVSAMSTTATDIPRRKPTGKITEKLEEGFKFPPHPQEPEESDCCGDGCTPCVWDLYDDEVKKWENDCELIRRGLNPTAEKKFDGRIIVPDSYRKFELREIIRETSDSNRYRFGLPLGFSLGLEAGQHLVLRCCQNEDKHITRQYTPISKTDARGYFDVLIRLYEKGPMSNCVRKWREGDQIEWRGPFGLFHYKPNAVKQILMLAAGTGIAPMAQIINTILDNPLDETKIRLIYSNRKYDDILCREEMKEWTAFWNFENIYTITQEDEESVNKKKKYGEIIYCQRIGLDFLQKQVNDLYQGQIDDLLKEDLLVLICGTKSFDKDMIKYLQKICLCERHYFKF